MKSKKKFLLSGLAIAIGACALLFVLNRNAPSRVWPDLLTDKQDAPRYNWEVAERDFGYRTGNHVPLTLFFKVPEGTELFTDRLVLNGDFQEVARKEHRERRGGEEFVTVDVTLQTFVLKPKWEVKPTITFRTAGGDTKKLDLLTIEIYSSATYDGRKDKHPKEPHLVYLNGGHLWYTGGCILLGVVGLVGSIGVMVRKRKPRVKKPKVTAPAGPFPAEWTPVKEAWAAITDGDHSKAAVTKVTELMRKLFGVSMLTVAEIRKETAAQSTVSKLMTSTDGWTALANFIAICEKPLWSERNINADEIGNAASAFTGVEQALLPVGK